MDQKRQITEVAQRMDALIRKYQKAYSLTYSRAILRLAKEKPEMMQSFYRLTRR